MSLVRTSRVPDPIVTYIICTNPRSGSSLLGEGLAATSLAGNPTEWFNLVEEQKLRARWCMDNSTDLTFQGYLDRVRAESRSWNGVSGVKLHWFQFADLQQKMMALPTLRRLTASQTMAKVFPNIKYLWLERRDKVRQAISFRIALATDEWWVKAGVTSNKHGSDPGEHPFDPAAIARLEQFLERNEAQWQAYFRHSGIVPFVLHYEDLEADYAGTIVRVLKWLGVPSADNVVIPPALLQRQSDARSEEWRSRYMAFKSAGGDPRLAAGGTSGKSREQQMEERKRKLCSTIPDTWKQWIAQSKLLHVSDDVIVQRLVNNGFFRGPALAEVKKAAADPYLAGAVRTQQRLAKGASLLNALARVARLDPQAALVERRSRLPRREFRDRYYAANRPVILQNLMTGWKAMKAWTPDYLKRVAGHALIEAMTGREADPHYEMNGREHRTALRFADYIDMVHSGQVTNDYDMVADNGFLQKPEARPLWEDFAIFPEYLNPRAADGQSFLWLGPAGTVSPLQHSTRNALMAQVAGRKRYRLIPAAQWHLVYNNHGVYSDVDCENPDLARYPKFRDATFIDLLIEPGEVLFIPVGWWHHVRALDVSMTVSFTNFVFPNQYTWH